MLCISFICIFVGTIITQKMENKGLRHYQQEAIQKVIPLIHQESRILISMPTGTGKSFTIINIVYEYYQRRGGVKEEKILFLVDRSVVADSIKRLALEKFDSVQVLKSITDAQPTISICNIRTPTLTNGFEKLPLRGEKRCVSKFGRSENI